MRSLPSEDRAVLSKLKILEVMSAHIVHGASFTVIFEETKLGRETISKWLDYFVSGEYIVKDENGNYRITPKGVECRNGLSPFFVRSREVIKEAMQLWLPRTIIPGNDISGTFAFEGTWSESEIRDKLEKASAQGPHHGYTVFSKWDGKSTLA